MGRDGYGDHYNIVYQRWLLTDWAVRRSWVAGCTNDGEDHLGMNPLPLLQASMGTLPLPRNPCQHPWEHCHRVTFKQILHSALFLIFSFLEPSKIKKIHPPCGVYTSFRV